MIKKRIAVDLDGTLAEYNGFEGALVIGKPIPSMVARVIAWIQEGHEVVIFTSRVAPLRPDGVPTEFVYKAIIEWCFAHIGVALRVTATKEREFAEFWDDRAVRVEKNTGRMMAVE